MLSKLIALLVMVGIIGFGGYFVYTNILMTPQQLVLSTSEVMSQLKTLHADMEITVNNTMTSTGQRVTSTIEGLSDIDILSKTQNTHLSLGVSGRRIEMDMVLLSEGEIFMKMPAITGDSWIHMNTQDLKDAGTLAIDPQSNDYVTQSLGFLKSVDEKTITKLEDETVDGVKATRLRLDISTPKYIEYLKQVSSSNNLADSFKGASVKTDIWIDKKTKYMIKMKSDVKNLKVLDASGSELGVSDMDMVITYSKFNQPITVERPVGNIVEYSQLTGGVKGAFTQVY